MSFGTFHSVFFTILKHAYNLSSANIILEEERRACIRDIVHNMRLEYEDEKEFISELLSEISMVKGIKYRLMYITPQAVVMKYLEGLSGI